MVLIDTLGLNCLMDLVVGPRIRVSLINPDSSLHDLINEVAKHNER
jgi:hypothetical protein